MSDRVATIWSEALPDSGEVPRCQLVVIEGPDQGRGVRIDAAEIIVGTAPECGLALTDDRVSARHVSVLAEGGRFVITDLESTNGTLYEGSQIARAAISAGATIKIGRTFLRIVPQREAVEVEPSQSRAFGALVAESLVMREVFAVLELAAQSNVTVLLEGETGTGKELAAQAIHDASDRRRGPFVAIDCGALPDSLLESELFGHVRGAFTGASATRAGAFARADGGTLFLDELAGVPLTVQARLLRALEERAIRPVGSDKERAVDVRVVAATREELEVKATEGTFRADLLYRLSVLKVRLPSLRARREDLPIIVGKLLERRGISPGAIAGPNLHRLNAHDWPGNVRELRNTIDRAIAMSPGAQSFADLKLALTASAREEDPLAVRTDLSYGDAKEAVLHAFEWRYLRDVLARCDGNISAASRDMHLDRKHLRTLLKKHGLIGDEEA